MEPMQDFFTIYGVSCTQLVFHHYFMELYVFYLKPRVGIVVPNQWLRFLGPDSCN